MLILLEENGQIANSFKLRGNGRENKKPLTSFRNHQFFLIHPFGIFNLDQRNGIYFLL
jgi:hypothetical protein